MRTLLISSVLVMAACGPEEEIATNLETEPPADEIELCDADEYRPLVGSNIASVTLPSEPGVRAFGQDDLITQDYRPERVNIVYDDGGVIFRVYCG